MCFCVFLCLFVVGLYVFVCALQNFQVFQVFQEGENHFFESLFAEGQKVIQKK